MTAIALKALPEFIRTRVAGREKLRRVLTNTGWLVADKVLRMGVGLFVGVWVARYLGSVRFGTLNYATAFVALFGPLATLGLDMIVVRNIVHGSGKDQTGEILGTAFTLKLVGSLAIFISSITAVCLLRSDGITRLMVGIIAAGTIFQSFDAIDFWFQSQVLAKYTVYARNAAFLVIALVKVTLLKMHAPLVAFALAGVGEIVLGSMGLILYYNLTSQSIRAWRFSLACARRLLSDSWLLMLNGVVIMLYMRIDQVMLGQMVGDREVGVYSAAVRLSEMWYFIPLAIISSIFPSIVEAKRQSDAIYSARIQKLLNLMALLGYAIAVCNTVLAGTTVRVIFGNQFADASQSLRVLCWGGVFVCVGVGRECWMINEGLMKFQFITAALGALTNVVLNLLLIPHYRSSGSAFASLVSYGVSAFGACFLFRQTRPIAVMILNALLLKNIHTLIPTRAAATG